MLALRVEAAGFAVDGDVIPAAFPADGKAAHNVIPRWRNRSTGLRRQNRGKQQSGKDQS